MFGIMVIGKRKTEAAIQPTHLAVTAFVTGAKVEFCHDLHLGIRGKISRDKGLSMQDETSCAASLVMG